MLTTWQLSAFLRSEQANAAPSGKTAQETTDAVKHTQDAIERTAQETTDAVKHTQDAIERTAQETTDAVKRTEDAIKKTQDVIEETQAEIVQQGQTLSGFTLVTTAFLPLSFCTSVFHLPSAMSIFWQETLLVFRHADREGIRWQWCRNIQIHILAEHRPRTCCNTTTNTNNNPLETSSCEKIEGPFQKELLLLSLEKPK